MKLVIMLYSHMVIQNNVKYTISYKPIEGYCTVIPTAYYKPLAIGIAELETNDRLAITVKRGVTSPLNYNEYVSTNKCAFYNARSSSLTQEYGGQLPAVDFNGNTKSTSSAQVAFDLTPLIQKCRSYLKNDEKEVTLDLKVTSKQISIVFKLRSAQGKLSMLTFCIINKNLQH